MAEPKACTKCGEEKERTGEYFYNDKRNKDGLTSDCKVCRREAMKVPGKANQKGDGPLSKEDRIAKIKERQEALARKKAASTAIGSAAAKIVKKRKTRSPRASSARRSAKPKAPAASSDQLIREINDVASVIRNGKVLLREKCQALLSALDRESDGQGHN